MNKFLTTRRLRNGVMLTALYIVGPLFILTTNPDDLPLLLLLMPFVFLFATVFVTVLLIGRKLGFLKGIDDRRQYALTALIAAIPMLLAVFQSLHQLSIRDVIIAVGLIVGMIFYISRADFLR